MGLRGIRVNGSDYKFDYRYLDNKPKHAIPSIDGQDGKCLVVDNSEIKWGGANAGDYLSSLDTDATGDVGTVVDGEWQTNIEFLARKEGSDQLIWKSIIPSYGGDHDYEEFLTVTSCGTAWCLGWCGIIPPHTYAGEGSSLCVDDNGELKWESVLPYHSEWDSGKVLAVDEDGDIEWKKVIPSHTTNDYGKVLSVTNNGPKWKSIDAIPQHDKDDVGSSLVVDEDGSIGWYRILPVAPCFNKDEMRVLTVDRDNMAWVTTANPAINWVPIPTGFSDETAVLVATDSGTDTVRWEPLESLRSIPDYEDADSGSVLAVGNDGLEWKTILPKSRFSMGTECFLATRGSDIYWNMPLPPYVETDAYKCLIVNQSADDVEWARIIPEYTISDAGKTLTVADNGQLKWK